MDLCRALELVRTRLEEWSNVSGLDVVLANHFLEVFDLLLVLDFHNRFVDPVLIVYVALWFSASSTRATRKRVLDRASRLTD